MLYTTRVIQVFQLNFFNYQLSINMQCKLWNTSIYIYMQNIKKKVSLMIIH